MKCRHCDSELFETLIDLGASPPSNSYLTEKNINNPEKWYPLKVMICCECWLVQTEDFVGVSEMFSEDYSYFSSFSSTWLNHCEKYVNKMLTRFELTDDSLIVEVASNDGYLLQYVKKAGIPCYGIEPTHSTAEAARDKGIEVIEKFFGVITAKELLAQGRQSDLIVANNVLAHVPDINDFVKGFTILLKPNGVASFEFPHLISLINNNQFDTIYHEHYSYLSLTAICSIFLSNGIAVFDVEKISTHGGSLRVFAQRQDTGQHPVTDDVKILLDHEDKVGVNNVYFYHGLWKKAVAIKLDFLDFLLKSKRSGKKVAAYGAAAKGNTLLNFAGVRTDLLPYVVDKSSIKQGKYLPGSRIPIVDESHLVSDAPDYVVILPWNLKTEIMEQLSYINDWGGRFVTVIPELEIE